MELVSKILACLAAKGFKTNMLKYKWGVQTTYFLGFVMTPMECKPMTKKIDALLMMSPPRNKKQLRSFLGGVNFYKLMFPRSSHTLRPLTALTGDKPFVWGSKQ